MATEYEIDESTSLLKKEVEGCDFSWGVTGRVAPPFDQSLESELHVENLKQPYRKQYNVDFDDFAAPEDDDDADDDDDDDNKKRQLIAVVKSHSRVRGYIHVREMWNKMASLEDIAVDRSLRGQKVGKALVDRAIKWTISTGLLALRAETQDNNILACYLYRSCGFKFGGYDSYLYAATQDLKHEKALFWYRFVDV